MAFWDELSSSTGSPTGSAIVEDPFARAVRIYQMELENAQAAAGARREDPRFVAPGVNLDSQEAIQREVIAPFEQFGNDLLAPFARSGRGGAMRGGTSNPRTGSDWSGPMNTGNGRVAQYNRETGEERVLSEGAGKAAVAARPMTAGTKRDFFANSTAMQELERQALAAEEAGATPEQLLRDFSLLDRTDPFSSTWSARMRPKAPVPIAEPRATYNPETGSMGFSGRPDQIQEMREQTEFADEQAARQAGKKAGDIVRLWDEKSRRFRQARIK